MTPDEAHDRKGGTKIKASKVYLCCGNKTGVQNPDEWLGVDIQEPCDLKADVMDIDVVDATWVISTPPCDGFTDLPWRPATNTGIDILKHCKALGEQAPFHLLENNRWAQRFIGPADFHRGGHYFWGNIIVADFRHNKTKVTGWKPGQSLKRAALPRGVILT